MRAELTLLSRALPQPVGLLPLPVGRARRIDPALKGRVRFARKRDYQFGMITANNTLEVERVVRPEGSTGAVVDVLYELECLVEGALVGFASSPTLARVVSSVDRRVVLDYTPENWNGVGAYVFGVPCYLADTEGVSAGSGQLTRLAHGAGVLETADLSNSYIRVADSVPAGLPVQTVAKVRYGQYVDVWGVWTDIQPCSNVECVPAAPAYSTPKALALKGRVAPSRLMQDGGVAARDCTYELLVDRRITISSSWPLLLGDVLCIGSREALQSYTIESLEIRGENWLVGLDRPIPNSLVFGAQLFLRAYPAYWTANLSCTPLLGSYASRIGGSPVPSPYDGLVCFGFEQYSFIEGRAVQSRTSAIRYGSGVPLDEAPSSYHGEPLFINDLPGSQLASMVAVLGSVEADATTTALVGGSGGVCGKIKLDPGLPTSQTGGELVVIATVGASGTFAVSTSPSNRAAVKTAGGQVSLRVRADDNFDTLVFGWKPDRQVLLRTKAVVWKPDVLLFPDHQVYELLTGSPLVILAGGQELTPNWVVDSQLAGVVEQTEQKVVLGNSLNTAFRALLARYTYTAGPVSLNPLSQATLVELYDFIAAQTTTTTVAYSTPQYDERGDVTPKRQVVGGAVNVGVAEKHLQPYTLIDVEIATPLPQTTRLEINSVSPTALVGDSIWLGIVAHAVGEAVWSCTGPCAKQLLADGASAYETGQLSLNSGRMLTT